MHSHCLAVAEPASIFPVMLSSPLCRLINSWLKTHEQPRGARVVPHATVTHATVTHATVTHATLPSR